MKLHHHPLSGHSHRVALLLSLLDVEHEKVEVDLAAGAHKSPEFLKLNAFGQVPVLVDGELVLRDSNAIIVYLATKYDAARSWLPVDAEGAAGVQSWLATATKDVVLGPANARLVTVFGAGLDASDAIARSHAVLAIYEAALDDRDWLVGDGPTLADVAGYSYIAHAPEGNVDLADYPSIRSWLARVEALEGFVPMQATPVGLAA